MAHLDKGWMVDKRSRQARKSNNKSFLNLKITFFLYVKHYVRMKHKKEPLIGFVNGGDSLNDILDSNLDKHIGIPTNEPKMVNVRGFSIV